MLPFHWILRVIEVILALLYLSAFRNNCSCSGSDSMTMVFERHDPWGLEPVLYFQTGTYNCPPSSIAQIPPCDRSKNTSKPVTTKSKDNGGVTHGHL
ncbi:hypothetical protein BDW42DRAFT_141541 [Aspergillus taichungensis]|uniref:Secreted protein n=1 Tax=Aspergillus taichungensis TaxID=482145 RepID=A0A2J5I6K0_9EURO|nr:hypothetical protein BDW42DRAFT_141541 [Aspergillus taichungensis]